MPQAVVSEGQIIVAVGVTQEANDVQQLEPMLQTMAHTLEAAGIEDRPKAGLADAGYWSEANIRACSWPEMPELLIATTKDWKQRKMLREKGCPRGRIPNRLSPRDRMERKLLTKRGRALYKKRGVLVEPRVGSTRECSRALSRLMCESSNRGNSTRCKQSGATSGIGSFSLSIDAPLTSHALSWMSAFSGPIRPRRRRRGLRSHAEEITGQRAVHPRIQETGAFGVRYQGGYLHVCKCTVPSEIREGSPQGSARIQLG